MTNVEQILFYQIHVRGSISERDPCHIQITPQHHSLKTRKTPVLLVCCYGKVLDFVIRKH